MRLRAAALPEHERLLVPLHVSARLAHALAVPPHGDQLAAQQLLPRLARGSARVRVRVRAGVRVRVRVRVRISSCCSRRLEDALDSTHAAARVVARGFGHLHNTYICEDMYTPVNIQ